MSYSSVNSPSRSIITAQVLEGGALALLMSDDSVVVAGNVIGPAGERGERGMPGVKGDRGDDGNTILTTDGPPQPSDGKEGDWAIDKRGLKLYGPKTSAGWGKGNPLTLTDAALDSAVRRFNSRGGPGGGRFFGMGAPSAGIAPLQAASTGLKPILGNGYALPARSLTKIADSAGGVLFDVKIRAEAASGVWVGTVNVGSFGAIADHTVYSELRLGAIPPQLTFTPQVVGGVLELMISSDIPLTKLEGVIIEVS